jgi:hypothetical protein
MKRRTSARILCLLLILLAAKSVCAKDVWTSVRSRNFQLIGNASEKEIRQVAERLEQFREVASHLFNKANLNSPVPTTVVIFKNDSSYRPFKPTAQTAGYFQPGPDVNYIALKTDTGDSENPFSVIFHEYTHLLIKNTSGNVPTWFNEGMAEYYSTFTISDDQKIVLGKPIAEHVYLLRHGGMLSLKTLFKVDPESPYYNERDKQSIFYAQSWALVHYLILGNKGQRLEQLGKFLQLIDTSVPMENAFQQAFHTTFEDMEAGLRDYVKSDRYPIAPAHFEGKLEFDRAMAATPLSDAEVQAYLGDLLLHSYRAEAESYLKGALALDPNLAIANAALGMLRVRQGKIAEARESLERAVEANSQNYLIHYYYAYALSREGMDERQLVSGYDPDTAARIRAELKKAIELRPDYPESYSLLAFVNLVTETNLDESIVLLHRILAASPGRIDLLFTLAQVYLRKHDFNTARDILEKLSKNQSDQRLRQQSQSMLTQLQAREEQLSRLGPAKSSENGSENTSFVAVEPSDPSTYLRQALRRPTEGERQVQALLVGVDCGSGGIIFIVRVEDRLLKLRTDSFENVSLVSFSSDAGREITCGPRKPENTVVICFVPSSDARSRIDGTIKSIEFVPRDFKLKA